MVQFGKQKIYSGIIHQVTQSVVESNISLKSILDVVDAEPLMDKVHLEWWNWLSKYYLCTLGEVMSAALPSIYKLQSETIIKKIEDNTEPESLKDDEYLVWEALSIQPTLKYKEVVQILSPSRASKALKGLQDKGIIQLEQEVELPTPPSNKAYIRFQPELNIMEFMQSAAFQSIEKKAPKQVNLIMAFLALENQAHEGWLPRELLIKKANSNSAALQSLIKKGVFELIFKEPHIQGINSNNKIDLSEVQTIALNQIHDGFLDKNVVLLHGITGSGKTEIYGQLIRDELEKGKDVLYMLPEISLTTQLITRLQHIIGAKVYVYHSRISERERSVIWKLLSLGPGEREPVVIIGARSGVFLPWRNLGLLVIDEEHDTSYKQNDPAPRYHARDAAVYLMHLLKVKTLLGSATPSLESYYNAKEGKFHLVELNQRYGNAQLPMIQLVDMKPYKSKEPVLFSHPLKDEIKLCLEEEKQVLVFKNRRGFAPMLTCQKCDWVPKCPRCDVSLTYHKGIDLIKCHYCGFSTRVPSTCEQCQSHELHFSGVGTERLEEDLSLMYAEANIRRMDLDSTRGKVALQNLIDDMSEGKVNILVGTQMVTKGFDFPGIRLVAVVDADSLLSFPDFRAHERAFSLLEQVRGRAGRRSEQGLMIVQTKNPGHKVFQMVLDNDYKAFYAMEIKDRQHFSFPPFHRLVYVYLKHQDLTLVKEAAAEFSRMMKGLLGNRVNGPFPPPVSRVNLQYIQQLMIKIEKEHNTIGLRNQILQLVYEFRQNRKFQRVNLVFDVDPGN